MDLEAVLAARGRLLDMAREATLHEVLQATLDELEGLTDSRIGFFHFLEADQSTLTLRAWSTRTARDFCRVQGQGSHYPMAMAGVWADAARTRGPVVHNDYASLPGRQGLPEGHAELLRELVVPILRGDRVVAILGVGNKPAAYDDRDQALVTALADLVWELAEHKRIQEDLGREEAALRESEFFFKECQRAAAIGSYKADFRLDRWQSSAVLDGLFGIDEAYDRSIANWLKIVHPDDREMMATYLTDQVIAKRQPFRKEYRIVRIDDGTTRWVNGLGEVSFDVDGSLLALTGTIQDITERRQAENEARQGEAQFRTYIERAPFGVFIADQQGRYLEVNPAASAITGFNREELLSMGIADLLTPESLEAGLHQFQALAEQGQVEVELGFRHKDGQAGKWLVEALALSPTRFLSFAQDLTARRQAESERAKLEYQLQQVQKLESLGSLAGGVAHDMNNVLAAILALASAHVTLQPEGSQAHHAFATIAEAATRGGKMVRSLLTFARQQPAEERVLDLNAILAQDISLLEHTTLARVRLATAFAPDLRPVLGDDGALVSAFMNLCVNAVDAMPCDGQLTLRTRNLPGDQVQVEIEDTGAGMTPEVLAKAMDPFFTTKETGKGTGLGLSMAFSTVKAHHGRLELHSQPGRGTCVRMTFPACQAEAPRAGPEPQAPPGPAAGGLSLLLVDDDDLVIRSTQMLLDVLGHSVHTAASGEEALAALEGGLRPDAVILDMNMPGMGGARVLPLLLGICPGLPILLATGRADENATRLVEAHPSVVLMAKPFSLDDLRANLERG